MTPRHVRRLAERGMPLDEARAKEWYRRNVDATQARNVTACSRALGRTREARAASAEIDVRLKAREVDAAESSVISTEVARRVTREASRIVADGYFELRDRYAEKLELSPEQRAEWNGKWAKVRADCEASLEKLILKLGAPAP